MYIACRRHISCAYLHIACDLPQREGTFFAYCRPYSLDSRNQDSEIWWDIRSFFRSLCIKAVLFPAVWLNKSCNVYGVGLRHIWFGENWTSDLRTGTQTFIDYSDLTWLDQWQTFQGVLFFSDLPHYVELTLIICCLIFIAPPLFLNSRPVLVVQCGTVAVFLSWFNLLLFFQRYVSVTKSDQTRVATSGTAKPTLSQIRN